MSVFPLVRVEEGEGNPAHLVLCVLPRIIDFYPNLWLSTKELLWVAIPGVEINGTGTVDEASVVIVVIMNPNLTVK